MSTITQETINAMALARMSFFHIPAMRTLVQRAGSFSAIVDNCKNIRDILPDVSSRLVSSLQKMAVMRERAEEEAEYVAANGIQVLTVTDEAYPSRLKACNDAPLVLFYKGNADLNCKRIVNIVGTRHATVYAEDVIKTLMATLKEKCPELLVVSGLAYGVDIIAHRASLNNAVPTVGVLAHGLDNLYPPRHRETANKMLGCGGLLTEHFIHTNADKINFVRRNRIVAGMSDATILIESASRGGGLITCSMAQDYGREVFAFPGRVGDKYSEGCNNLIRDNGARLVTSGDDIVNAMGWETDAALAVARGQGIERELFPEYSGDEKTIVDCLAENGDMQLNVLSVKTSIPISCLTSTLFTLEMQGVLKALAGGVYHLIK